MYTDGSCALYLYLPNGAATSLVETASNCFIGNNGIDDPIVTNGVTTGSLYFAYAVKFETNGGNPMPGKYFRIGQGGFISRPVTNPEREHYVFYDWYEEPECATLFDFVNTKVTGPTTIYAKWYPHPYIITYDLTGGANTPENPDVYTMESDDISLAAPSKAGYDFAGWSGTGVTGVKRNVTIPAGSTGNREYTAHWNAAGTRVVTFDSQGGTSVDGLDHVAYYSKIPAALIPSKEHCTFKGWYKDSACKYAWKFSKYRMPDRLLTLYVKWQRDSYKITFNSKSGSRVSSKTGYWGLPLSAPKAPKRTGYIFGGWFKDAAFTDDWAFSTGGDVVTGKITLYAKWTAKTYTVTYDSRGGSPIGPDTEVPYGTLCERPDTPPVYINTGLVTHQPYYYKVRAYRYVSGRKVYSSFTVFEATASEQTA